MTAEAHTYADEDELLEDYFERGWTDGLPIVAPTAEKVGRFHECLPVAHTGPLRDQVRFIIRTDGSFSD